jgi:hypothetical protein
MVPAGALLAVNVDRGGPNSLQISQAGLWTNLFRWGLAAETGATCHRPSGDGYIGHVMITIEDIALKLIAGLEEYSQ